MLEVGVHEHVRDELIGPEVLGQHEMEAEEVVERDAMKREHVFHSKHQDIDDDQILCNGRCLEHIISAKTPAKL